LRVIGVAEEDSPWRLSNMLYSFNPGFFQNFLYTVDVVEKDAASHIVKPKFYSLFFRELRGGIELASIY